MYVKLPRNKIARMEIVITDRKLSLSQVIEKYKCNYAINGGLYNMRTGELCDIPLRVNGKTMATSQYGYWMLAWNNGSDIKMIHSKDMINYKYAIACATMLKDGQNTTFTYDAAQGGTRGRTGFGCNNNEIILYVTTDKNNPMKPEALRNNMKNIGTTDAIMLDCGGSSQMYANGTYLQAEKRKVAYWICIWIESQNIIVPNKTCPYQEPTVNLKNGSKGERVKWLQWQLNRLLGTSLVVDGSFGPATKTALITFQKKYKLDADGICGKMTRTAIKSL